MNTTEQLTAWTLLFKGGAVMIPILMLSLVSIYLILVKWQYIKHKHNPHHDLIVRLEALLLDGNIKLAISLCDQVNTATSLTIKSGIQAIGQPIKEVESRMETAAQLQIAYLEKGLGYLGVIAGIAPMLGFIGTISGVIKIFYTISLSDNISIGGIAGGLYEKMISSGSGLIVGVVAYTGYHLLNIMIDRCALHIQEQSFDFVRLIQQPSYENQKK